MRTFATGAVLLLCCAADAFAPPSAYQRISSLQRRSSGCGCFETRSSSDDTSSSSSSVSSSWRRPDLFGTSLVEQTVAEMEMEDTAQAAATAATTKEERTRRRRALDALGVPSFSDYLQSKQQLVPVDTQLNNRRRLPTVLQLNIGLYCNQACGHCHVESSPLRTESMTAATAAQCLQLLVNTPSITTLDITGGAPELNPQFRYLVATARQLKPDLEIIDRCNLTVLQEPGQGADLIQFLKQQGVRIVASLPCYSETNVDQQRGSGVFARSIAALLALNEAGYGTQNNNNEYKLDLVYNPSGAFLPPPQAKLQQQYQEQLQEHFGIQFNDLFTMTNMPIKRFADYLHQRKQLNEYLELLVQNFNVATLENLMCRDTVSVGYDGRLYDCDFNQQLGCGMGGDDDDKGDLTVFDVDNLGADLAEYAIRHDNHCFGCTAGMGSS